MSKLPFVRTGVAYAIALTFFASAAVADTTTCSISTACAVYQNTGTGVAFHAQTTSGTSLRANSASGTGIYAGTVSGTTTAAGIDAENTGTPGNGQSAAGVFGATAVLAGMAAPTQGVVAYGTYIAGEGQTTATGASKMKAGVGLGGIDPISSATDYNFGVVGQSSGSGVGVYGAAGSSMGPSGAYYGIFPIGVYALGDSPANNQNTAIGIFIESDNQAISAHNTKVNSYVYADTPSNLLQGASPSGSFDIDNSGNETITGSLTTANSVVHVTKGADGATRAAYGARTTAPDVEDLGQATIVDGHGYVRIDPALRNSIDQRTAYLVFLTPEGDCNGLYVSHRSPDGFEIRELRGGRSSLDVAYRIAAKPLGQDARRLAAVAPLRVAADHDVRRTGSERPLLISPIDRMRATLGPAAYAEVVRDAKRQLSDH